MEERNRSSGIAKPTDSVGRTGVRPHFLCLLAHREVRNCAGGRDEEDRRRSSPDAKQDRRKRDREEDGHKDRHRRHFDPDARATPSDGGGPPDPPGTHRHAPRPLHTPQDRDRGPCLRPLPRAQWADRQRATVAAAPHPSSDDRKRLRARARTRPPYPLGARAEHQGHRHRRTPHPPYDLPTPMVRLPPTPTDPMCDHSLKSFLDTSMSDCRSRPLLPPRGRGLLADDRRPRKWTRGSHSGVGGTRVFVSGRLPSSDRRQVGSRHTSDNTNSKSLTLLRKRKDREPPESSSRRGWGWSRGQT